ncbi:MAG: threonine synthase [Alphaproteobacteria bacterium]|nr:threonine synthase [Alphaproteobacteria bacterium]
MPGYISTRGAAPRLNFADAALTGLARDGGLYVPDVCPQISDEELRNMAGQNYLEIAWRVISPFVGEDISAQDLILLLQKSYKNFAHPEKTPLRKLEDGFYVQELFHGPTLAFKDVALQFLGQVFDFILKARGQKVTIVGATSGDTGSAAIEAFKNSPYANIVILHPKGRVSDVQRRQMSTVDAPNVRNIAIEGSFDDCQDLVKAMFGDLAFRDSMQLSAINSINWARILAQVVYYIYAGVRVRAETGKASTFCVPTGNFGNVYAGYVAKSMGLPVEKLIVATNANDILHRFYTTGRMERRGVVPTISPSMDIQISSNFERLLFDLYGRDGAAVAATMKHFRDAGPFDLSADIMARLSSVFASGRKDDVQTTAIIRDFYRRYDYVVDPHTAVGLGVAEDWKRAHPDAVMVTLATAHPAKFPDAVKAATDVAPELPPHMADLMAREERYDVLPADLAKVQDYIRAAFGGAA